MDFKCNDKHRPARGTKQMTTETNDEIGDDLEFTKITRQAAGTGTWVCGKLNGHSFEALVFPAHAESDDYELGQSRISKLRLKQLSDRATVFNFDRGWDVRSTTELAGQVADFLCAGLAEHVFG